MYFLNRNQRQVASRFFLFLLLTSTYIAGLPRVAQGDEALESFSIQPTGPAALPDKNPEMSRNPITVESIIQSIATHFPRVKNAREEIKRAEYNRMARSGEFDLRLGGKYKDKFEDKYANRTGDISLTQPTTLWGAEVEMGYRIGTGEFEEYEGDRQTLDNGEARIQLRVPLLQNGWIDERRRDLSQSKLEIERAREKFRLVDLETTEDALNAYFSWVEAGLIYRVINNLLDVAEARQVWIQERVRSGAVPKIDQVDNERLIMERRQQLVDAERSFQSASIKLSLFYRNAEGAPFIPNSHQLPAMLPATQWLDDKEIAAAKAKTLEFRPEFDVIERELDQLEVERKYLYNQIFPKLNFVGEYSQDYGDGSSSKKGDEGFIGLNLDFPLFLRKGLGKFQAVKSKQRILETKRQFLQEKISNMLLDATSEVRATYNRVLLNEKELELANKLEAAERTKFRLGDSNLIFVNVREQATASVSIRNIKALRGHHFALVKYKVLTGSMF